MHAYIATLLFIATALSPACGQPTLQPPLTPQPPLGCLTQHTTYYEFPSKTLLFTAPNDPNFTLSITTQYPFFYPRVLSAWLEEKRFTLLNASTLTDAALCGWTSGGSVAVHGRRHGQIRWKRTLDSDAPSTTTSQPHVPHDTPMKPSRETLNTVKSILRENTPHADILFLRVVMLQVACGLLAFFFAYYLLSSCALRWQRRRQRKAVDEDKEGVELDVIRVHGLSGEGMRRLDEAERTGCEQMEEERTEAEQPVFGIVVTKPDAASSTGSVADPPPVYSLDGAGREARVREMV